MTDSLKAAMAAAASGMHVQGTRLKIISENMANAESTSEVPGGDPYRRKIITFESVLDRSIGTERVEVKSIKEDPSNFRLRYDPSHPGANDQGYVKLPNVNSLIEMSDMREASRSYEANIRTLETARSMQERTIDLLR